METIRGWYANIGKKIKTLVMWMFVVEMIITIIAGVTMFIIFLRLKSDDSGIYLAFLSIIAIPFAILIEFVNTWILYAFGELVDKVCNIDCTTACSRRDIAKLVDGVCGAKSTFKVRRIVPENIYHQDSDKDTYDNDSIYMCPSCGYDIKSGASNCPRCGQKIDWP